MAENQVRKIQFFCIYLLVMPKYWGKQIFSFGSFPEVGQKQKTQREKEERRVKVSVNNGQLRIEKATSGGARKPPGPILVQAYVLNIVNTDFHSFSSSSLVR